VDTATSEFYFSSFNDDLEMTQLETLLLQIKPVEIIAEKVLYSDFIFIFFIFFKNKNPVLS